MNPVQFPGWYYGPNGEAAIFQCAADVPAGWKDNPNEFKVKAAKPDDPNTASRAEMYATLTARGIPFDKRWKDDRLKALLA